MDPFLLVKLLLLSCNLDEEANQHFLTRSLRKATACWFLNGAGLVVVGKAAVRGQLWAARPNFVLGSKPSSKFLLFVFANDLSLFPWARHLSVQAVHASPLQATPDEAGPRPITSSRMSAQTLCCALGLGLSLAPLQPSAQQTWGASCNAHLLLAGSSALCAPPHEALAPWHSLHGPKMLHLPASSPPSAPWTPRQTCCLLCREHMRRPPMPFPLPGEDFFQALPLSQTFFSLNQYFLLFLDLPGGHSSGWASLSLDTGVSCSSHAPLLPNHGPASPAGHTCLHAHRAPRQSRVLAFLACPTELLGGMQPPSMRARYTGE